MSLRKDVEGLGFQVYHTIPDYIPFSRISANQLYKSIIDLVPTGKLIPSNKKNDDKKDDNDKKDDDKKDDNDKKDDDEKGDINKQWLKVTKLNWWLEVTKLNWCLKSEKIINDRNISMAHKDPQCINAMRQLIHSLPNKFNDLSLNI